jgi:transposase-like protein
MRYQLPKFTNLADMAAIDVARLTEDEARVILEVVRWPDGPTCPHCNSQKVTRLQARSTKVRDGLFQCNGCRQQFTVTVGTVMHRSHVTLRQWVQAFHSICSHKKGVSALQLQRNLGLRSYRSAWYLAHRVRHALKEGPLAGKLCGTVEVDETYVGGKPRGRASKPGIVGRGTQKTPVVALIARDGRAKTRVVASVDAKTLKDAIRAGVARDATIMTDEYAAYRGIGGEFSGGHHTVNHGRGEYARGEVSTNTAESFFALLKRGVHGTFHHVSREHLHRYCDEFAFRWSNRRLTDGERTVAAIRGAAGRRLVYRRRPAGR